MAATVDLEVIGQRQSARMRAVVDTGFEGSICLPVEVAVNLGLELTAYEFVQYADGRVARELVFHGKVRFLKRKREARISLTESEEALLGLELLRGYRMVLDGDTHQVRFERKGRR